MYELLLSLICAQKGVIRLDYWRVGQIKCHDAKRLQWTGSATLKWRDIENKTIWPLVVFLTKRHDVP
jgi:hypothetical protein